MNRRNNRSGWQRFVGSPITLVAGLVVLVFLARSSARIHAKAGESQVRLMEAQANLTRVQANETTLKTQISNLSTDDGVVTEIRKKFHAVEPGEDVAVVINRDENKQSATTTASTAAWWQFWR